MASDTVKTTVYLDASAYRRLKAMASAEGRPATELIRQAVTEFADRHAPMRTPTSLGRGRSDPTNGSLSERAEDLLDGMGTPT